MLRKFSYPKWRRPYRRPSSHWSSRNATTRIRRASWKQQITATPFLKFIMTTTLPIWSLITSGRWRKPVYKERSSRYVFVPAFEFPAIKLICITRAWFIYKTVRYVTFVHCLRYWGKGCALDADTLLLWANVLHPPFPFASSSPPTFHRPLYFGWGESKNTGEPMPNFFL